ncbi:MAG: rhomboid family intramembrane serine protease [Flavobacteriaceae bacterium]|nr:MAG: rhomboid family intramembrane serine protease [Flavobacteriaceae bacterium]
MRGITPTIKHLIIINVLLWIATLSIGTYGQELNNLFALHFPKNGLFQPWQIITHMFMHASYVLGPTGAYTVYFQHILFNMFALWMFGSAVEQTFGKKKFIFFYISAGLGAALISLGVDYAQFLSIVSDLSIDISGDAIKEILAIDSNNGKGYLTGELFSKGLQPIVGNYNLIINPNDFGILFNLNATGLGFKTMVGASGAIMGVLVAYGMLFPESKLMLIFLPIPIKAKYFIPAIIGLDLFSALTGVSLFSPSNTAYIAHLGGAFTGFIMMWYWKKNQFNDKRWD